MSCSVSCSRMSSAPRRRGGARAAGVGPRYPGLRSRAFAPVRAPSRRHTAKCLSWHCAVLLRAALFSLLTPCAAYAAEQAPAFDYRVGKFFGAVDARVLVRTYTNEAGAQEQSTALSGQRDRFAVTLDLHRQPAANREPPYGLVDPNSPAMVARYKAAARERLSVDVGGVKYRLHGLRGVGAKYSVSPNESYEASVRRSSVTGKPRYTVQYRQAF
jgi:hypothetical protein